MVDLLSVVMTAVTIIATTLETFLRPVESLEINMVRLALDNTSPDVVLINAVRTILALDRYLTDEEAIDILTNDDIRTTVYQEITRRRNKTICSQAELDKYIASCHTLKKVYREQLRSGEVTDKAVEYELLACLQRKDHVRWCDVPIYVKRRLNLPLNDRTQGVCRFGQARV